MAVAAVSNSTVKFISAGVIPSNVDEKSKNYSLVTETTENVVWTQTNRCAKVTMTTIKVA